MSRPDNRAARLRRKQVLARDLRRHGMCLSCQHYAGLTRVRAGGRSFFVCDRCAPVGYTVTPRGWAA